MRFIVDFVSVRMHQQSGYNKDLDNFSFGINQKLKNILVSHGVNMDCGIMIANAQSFC